MDEATGPQPGSNDQPDVGTQPTSDQNQTQPGAAPTVKPGGSKRLLWVVLLVLILGGGGAGLWAWLSYSADQNMPIKIGVALPFSGQVAAASSGEMKGIELAQKQLNATKITLVQEDTKCSPDTAKAAVQKLIAQKVVAIIGDACSGSSLATLPDLNTAKVPMVSASATSPDLSKPDDYFFRVVPNDNFQGKFSADTMYQKGIRKVSVLYDDESYGQGLSKAFTDDFKSLGGTITSLDKYQNTDTKFDGKAAAIAAAKPEGVYLLSLSTSNAVAIMKSLQAAGVKVPVYSGDSLNDYQLINTGGAAVEGLYITTFPAGTQTFQQTLKNTYSDNQYYASAQAYDAFQSLYLAYKAGARTGEAFKLKLPNVSFDGVSGPISFDKNGEISNASYKYDLLQVHDGKFVTVN